MTPIFFVNPPKPDIIPHSEYCPHCKALLPADSKFREFHMKKVHGLVV